jgi:hypothetical protein
LIQRNSLARKIDPNRLGSLIAASMDQRLMLAALRAMAHI